MPVLLRAHEDPPYPAYGTVLLYMNEWGQLCLRDSYGQILYCVLSTTPPVPGQPITAPHYDYQHLPPALNPKPLKPDIPESIWNYLLTQDD